MTITIYSKPVPEDVKEKIIIGNIKKYLEECNEDFIKRDLEIKEW